MTEKEKNGHAFCPFRNHFLPPQPATQPSPLSCSHPSLLYRLVPPINFSNVKTLSCAVYWETLQSDILLFSLYIPNVSHCFELLL